MKRFLAVAALAGAGLASAALPASASIHHYAQLPGLAITQLSNRPDGGHGGTWATDTIQRNLTIHHVGGDAYTATVTDEGSFVTIPGAGTPNQAVPYAGDVVTTSRVAGAMTSLAGTVTYSFTADRAPDFSLVPTSESGAPVSGPQTTSLWFEQAFPAGTNFTGGLTDYSFSYRLKCPQQFAAQSWTDSQSNGDGNLPGDGNIFGC